MESPEKRSAETAGIDGEADAKRAKAEAETLPEEDDFDLLVESGAIDQKDEKAAAPAEAPEEAARRQFVERLAALERIDGESLTDSIEELQTRAVNWGYSKRWRCSALLLVYVARSTRSARATFVAEGLPLLGSVLLEGITVLESSDPASDRQEAGMWVLASLCCLRSLPIGRATMWEHRQVLGKPFDRLHRWCGADKSAIAAELRGHTTALCRRWRKQPKPAEQESDPNTKALRFKVVDMISQGLAGIAGLNSPASPAMFMASPGRFMLPASTSAAEVEAVLFSRYNNQASAEYRAHARMLRSNLALPTNAVLRNNVLTGDVSPEELINKNSNTLAPDSVQEQRLIQQQKALRASIIKEQLKPPPIYEDGKTDYNPATAPPLLDKRNSSGDLSRKGSGEELAAASSAPMPPPPTPFQDGMLIAPPSVMAGGIPAMMATPAPGQEDEDEVALIQWLGRPT